MIDSINIEGCVIGVHEPTLLVAEISANHDQDLNQALALVDIVADAGWDCVKLQTYGCESLTLRKHSSCYEMTQSGTDNLYIFTKRAVPMVSINRYSHPAKKGVTSLHYGLRPQRPRFRSGLRLRSL